jgi:methionyl-tRNA synthetase
LNDDTKLTPPGVEDEGAIMVTIEDFQKFEFVVAHVLDAQPHPDADRLLLLKVDCGDESPRQLVAGIRKSYTPEELVGRQIVMIKNLEPAEIRGQVSQGMILAASGDSGPVLLKPEVHVPVGSKIR